MGEQPEREIEARLDGIGALVNLHHAITGEYCPRHLAVGMTTAAVSSLRSRLTAAEELNKRFSAMSGPRISRRATRR